MSRKRNELFKKIRQASYKDNPDSSDRHKKPVVERHSKEKVKMYLTPENVGEKFTNRFNNAMALTK